MLLVSRVRVNSVSVQRSCQCGSSGAGSVTTRIDQA